MLSNSNTPSKLLNPLVTATTRVTNKKGISQNLTKSSFAPRTHSVSKSAFQSSISNRYKTFVAPRPSEKPAWATYDIPASGTSSPHTLRGFVKGKWVNYDDHKSSPVVDPLHKQESLFQLPALSSEDLGPFIDEVKGVPRSGLFNLYKNPEKYVEMGDVLAKAARELHDPVTLDYFAKLIQLTMPKSRAQAVGEVTILRKFLENFSGDRVRMLMRGFTQAGDRAGQISNGLRFPFGATAVVAPFNFPLEIIGMQTLGSVMVGNYTVVKAATSVSIVMEAFLEFLLYCGLDPKTIALLPAGGRQTEELLTNAPFRCTQFTGSSWVGERLANVLQGKVKLEDAGFDMKVLGPDVPEVDSADWEHVTWQCDMDAYAISGQKCSAQSFLAIHENWLRGDAIERSKLIQDLKQRASTRSIDDLSLGPLLGHSPKDCRDHLQMLMSLEGAKLLFGGKVFDGPLPASAEAESLRPTSRSVDIQIPEQYGMMEPTAVYVPLRTLKNLPEDHAAFHELFGPLQLVTSFEDKEVDGLMDLVDSFSHHLTSGIVSNDTKFLNKVLGSTIHGVTYAGNRARTTGAPQNHWFGPAGDPRGCGIGTPEAILHTWTNHREVIMDQGVTEGVTRNQS